MNKGFKNYTKRITQAVGDVAEVSVNVNKADSNVHITIPLLSTIGKCPMATSLVFDLHSKGANYGFGRGMRLNYYSRIEEVYDGYKVTNSDGTVDKYLTEKDCFNIETGMQLVKNTDEYDLSHQYKLKDTQNNSMEYLTGSQYPKIIQKANGDKITFDYISAVNKIYNAYGDSIEMIKEEYKVSTIEYYHKEENETTKGTLLARAEILYSGGYIKEITYYNQNGKAVKKLELSFSDSCIIVKDAISGYRIQYTISDGVVTSIKDGYDDSFTRGNEITIAAVDGRTTITDEQTGKVSYIIFDSDNYPLYEVDDNGSVVEYAFDKDTNQMIFQSHPMHTKDVNENLASGVTPTLNNVTEAEVAVTDGLGQKLVGTSAKKYTAGTGGGTITYKISKSGISTDNVSAMVFGRFVDGTYNDLSAIAQLKLNSSDVAIGARIDNVVSGDFDVAVMGVTAKTSYSYIQLVIAIPEGASVEVGGIRVFKQECGAFYEYDEQGNITEAVSGNKSKEVVYDAGKATQTIGVDSALVNHEYNDKNQLTKSTHAYGANVVYDYDETHPNNVVKTTVRSGNGNVIMETSRTYTEDGRFVSTETDVNGMTKTYLYADECGNLSQVKDTMSVVTNYKHFPNGLLEELELTDNINSTKAKYTYDDKKRISTVELTNASKYTFEYDNFDNISVIKLNGIVVFRYEYDSKNRLVKQHYGESSDCYEFTYTVSSLIDKIYYVNNGVKTLKYTYNYDIINRVSEVTDANNSLICRYEYDADGRVSKVVGADSTIEVGYDNLGNVNTKKATVSGKTIAQSFDTVNRSKGSHPEAMRHLDIADYGGVYFGLFDKDSNIYDYADNKLAPVDHNGDEIELDITVENYIPCCRIDSTRLMSYKLEMDGHNNECGFVAFCFKPDSIRDQYLFSIKNPSDDGSINVSMNSLGRVHTSIVDMNGGKHSIITSTNKVVAGEWNYFAMSFMNRYEEYGSSVTEVAVNLNGHIDNYTQNTMILFELGLAPVYNIGHNFDGTNVSSCFEGAITCVTIAPRDYVTYIYLHKHYASIKEHRINNILVDSDENLAAVDFSDVNLYTTNSEVTSKFEIYPLHNSVESINGDRPTKFEHRSIGEADKDRNFNFNHKSKRYAYVADGSSLKYDFGSGESGTVMMRAYIDSNEDKQYFFDMTDAAGNTLGLFRDSSRIVCIDFNGEVVSTGITFLNDAWKTVGLSFDRNIVSDSESTVTYLDLRAYVDGQTYQLTRNVDFSYGALELSVGKSYTPDTVRYFLGNTYTYRPLLGQVEMLATSSAFCEKATLDTLAAELKTYTKVCEFDDLGMLRKTEVHCAGAPILSDVITYKKNGENTTMCVANEKFTHNGSVRTRTYTTDLYGRVTAVSDTVLGNHTYEYDYRGFLVKEDNTEFAYDGNGNMTRSGDTVFTYDSVIKDRLMSVGGKPITYSESNPLNPKTYDGKTFEFEGRRLVKVTSDDMVATYKYDASGLRTEKTVTENGVTTTTKFVYDSGKLITEYTGTSRVDYLYDENGMLYGFIYNNAKYFYIRDTLQNILGIVDANGTAVVHYDYTAYGECTEISGSMANTVGVVNSFRYKGYYFDEENKFFYCKSRFYLPQWCRWLNCDNPVYVRCFDVHSASLFGYCENNPIMFKDDGGCIAKWLVVVIAIVAVVAVVAVVNHVSNAIMSAKANSEVETEYTEEEAKIAIENITGENTVKFYDTNVEISNSDEVKSRYDRIKISKIIQNTVDSEGAKITSRTTYSLAAEWFGHNAFNFVKDSDRTRNVNLDYQFKDNDWYTEVGTVLFMILGFL